MRTWKKIAIGGGVAVLVAAGVSISVYESRKNIVTVQTARAQRLDLVSIVSASGEIKPKTYVNIGANAFGKITKLYVKEGDRVKKGQLLAQLEMAQAKAQTDSAERHITQIRANRTHASDALKTTAYAAPFDGMIPNLPVREGETVVIGIQNSPGSTLMTIADMSVITAEVKVDETDIVNVTMGQPAEVSIDAIPKKTFKAVVTEIGNNAIVRSTGVSTSQQTSASQEAKDFKVVVTLQDPPEDLRPGLSATAKITTATRSQALTIPIQALTIRRQADLESKTENGAVQAAGPQNAASKQKDKDKEEIQGVFVIRNGKAEYVPIVAGITGTTDIEILKGLREGDEIVTGSYKVLRTMRPGASVKVDNKAPKKEDES